MPPKMYELIEPYCKTIPNDIMGAIICRTVVLAIGAVMTISILSVSRTENSALSAVGKRTATILVFSGFIVKICSRIGFYYMPWLKM